MFCPRCGTLAHPSPSGDITCPNYKCGYVGPASIIVKDEFGNDIDISKIHTQTIPEIRDYTPIKDTDRIQGVLTEGAYICPKRNKYGKSCDCTEVYAYVNSNLEFGETSAKMLTCKKCGHGWREF